jgi:dethiobiotin synthetase
MTKTPHGTALAVVGTDTAVGKTLIAAAVARFFFRQGFTVGVFKPAESGCTMGTDGLRPSDALFLIRASSCKSSLDLINPYRFALPVSPAAAARSASEHISMEHMGTCLDKIRMRHTVTFIEGAGGLMVPFGPDWLLADWLQDLDVPALVVGRAQLGTINHCLLTLSELRRRSVQVAGVVLNHCTNRRGPELSTNPQAIERYSGVKVLGTMPFQHPTDMDNIDALAHTAQRNLDLTALARMLSLADTETREN